MKTGPASVVRDGDELRHRGCGKVPLPGVAEDVRHWQRADQDNCTCSGDSKYCTLKMPRQGLSRIVLSAPRGDIPAYPVFEIDGGVYGRLHSVLAPRNGRRPGNEPIKNWIDVGANLGVLSIALALANPAAVGWAYEPNPATFAYLRANIAANGLEGRLHAVNAGVTRNGRPIFMPECVIKNPGGSQMATTQWHNGRTTQSCFSQACKAKIAGIAACMRENPRMTRIPSVTLDDAFAAAGVLLNASTSSSSSDSSQGDTGTIEVGKHRHGEQLDFLKVDCEGCEHEVMSQIEAAKTTLKVLKITGECHRLSGLTNEAAEACLRVLRGETCRWGVSAYMTCNGRARSNGLPKRAEAITKAAIRGEKA